MRLDAPLISAGVANWWMTFVSIAVSFRRCLMSHSEHSREACTLTRIDITTATAAHHTALRHPRRLPIHGHYGCIEKPLEHAQLRIVAAAQLMPMHSAEGGSTDCRRSF